MGQAPDELMYGEDLPPTESGTPPDQQENPSIPELRDEIAQTRVEMSGTLDALEARLSPQALADEARAKARAKAEESLNRARVLVREYVQPPVEQGARQVSRGAALVAAQAQQLAARVRQLQRDNPATFGVVVAAIGTGLAVTAMLLARAVNRTSEM